jgi:hypothetical protein
MSGVPADDSVNAERYRVAYDEGLRALERQEKTLDEFRARVSATITTTVIATAFFGTITMRSGWPLNDPEWAALALFVVGLIAQIFLLVPLGGWRFRRSAKNIIDNYVEGDDPASLSEMYKVLAEYLDDDFTGNEGRLSWMWWLFSGTCLCLAAEIIMWLLAIVIH